MSIKAQTPRERTLPSRAPTTLPQAGSQGAGMHAPAPARERRKHGQAGQEAQQPPASPAAVCFSISNNYYKQSLFLNRWTGIWPMPACCNGMIFVGMLRGLSSSDCISAIGARSALNGRETLLKVRRSSGVGRPLGKNRWQASLLLGKRFVSHAYKLPIAFAVVRNYSSAAPVRLGHGRSRS